MSDALQSSEANAVRPPQFDLFMPIAIGDGGEPRIAGSMTLLPFAALVASQENPRKTFDDDSIAELADSIRQQGLLQNLTVCVADGKGRHVILAGERRYRALKLLVEAGQWERDAATIPCTVRDVDASQARVIGLLENLQRENIPPMEEARALLELHESGKKKWSTENIAREIGKTQRYVQKRLALAQKLSPKAAEAIEKGELSIQQAEALTVAPKKVQEQLLGEARDTGEGYDVMTPSALRREALNSYIAAKHALFDLEEYEGDTITDDATGDAYLMDVKQFWKLQRLSIAARLAELKAQHKDVRRVDETANEHFQDWRWVKAGNDAEGAVVFVEIKRSGEVIVHPPMVDRDSRQPRLAGTGAKAKAKKTGAAAAPPPEAQFTKALAGYARQAKTVALQTAIAGDPKLAQCVAILGMMELARPIRVTTPAGLGWAEDNRQSLAARSVLQLACEDLTELMTPSQKKDARETGDAFGDKEEDEAERQTAIVNLRDALGFDYWMGEEADAGFFAKALAWLLKLSDKRRNELFCALIAVRTGTWNERNPELGDHYASRAIAEAARVDMAKAWQIDRAYLDLCRKPRLVALIDAIEKAVPEFAPELEGLDRQPAKHMAAKLAEILPQAYAKGFSWLPPEMEFTTREVILAQVKKGDAPKTVKAEIAKAKAPGKKAAKPKATKAAGKPSPAKPKAKQGKPSTAKPKKATHKKAKKR